MTPACISFFFHPTGYKHFYFCSTLNINTTTLKMLGIGEPGNIFINSGVGINLFSNVESAKRIRVTREGRTVTQEAVISMMSR